jgi:hypothetical protein
MTDNKNCSTCGGTGWVDFPKCTKRCCCWQGRLKELTDFGNSTKKNE